MQEEIIEIKETQGEACTRLTVYLPSSSDRNDPRWYLCVLLGMKDSEDANKMGSIIVVVVVKQVTRNGSLTMDMDIIYYLTDT